MMEVAQRRRINDMFGQNLVPESQTQVRNVWPPGSSLDNAAGGLFF